MKQVTDCISKNKNVGFHCVSRSTLCHNLMEYTLGYGSVLNLDGDVEMDASIMVGENLSAGAVTVVKDIEHPIR